MYKKLINLILFSFIFTNISGQTLREEADLQINDLIKNRYFKYELDSYFTYTYSQVVEVKRLSYNIIEDSLTLADSLNGLSWKGKVLFNCVTFRTIEPKDRNFNNSTWTEWGPGKKGELILVKKKNNWRFTGVKNFYYSLVGEGKPSPEIIKSLLLRPMNDYLYQENSKK